MAAPRAHRPVAISEPGKGSGESLPFARTSSAVFLLLLRIRDAAKTRYGYVYIPMRLPPPRQGSGP